MNQSFTFQLYGYAIPLKNNLERTGILLFLGDNEGRTAWSEVAPLSGWSRETLDQALTQLKHVLPLLSRGCVVSQPLLPSVAFGIESAIDQLNGSKRGGRFLFSGLITGTLEEMRAKARELIDMGCKSAKAKISQLSRQEALSFLKEFQPHFKMRIDINRAWTLAEALHFFNSFPAQAFDYVEEPINAPDQLWKFSHPFALDESFRENPNEDLFCFPHFKALVWKPTLQAGREALLKHSKQKIVLSSAYESGIGIAQIAHLGQKMGFNEPMGLDTYSAIQDDLIEERFSLKDGYLEIPPILHVKTELLRALS